MWHLLFSKICGSFTNWFCFSIISLEWFFFGCLYIYIYIKNFTNYIFKSNISFLAVWRKSRKTCWYLLATPSSNSFTSSATISGLWFYLFPFLLPSFTFSVFVFCFPTLGALFFKIFLFFHQPNKNNWFVIYRFVICGFFFFVFCWH